MREQEMRRRVEKVLGSFRRRALISAVGMGLPWAGCATGGATAPHGRPPVQADAGDESTAEVGEPRAVYAALVPRRPAIPPRLLPPDED